MNISLIEYEIIDSTNDEALKLARSGADEGVCVLARQQTAGRGRQGRTWMSERDAGLYFSIILRPNLETKFLPLITLMTGVAVHDTLREFGIKPDIKWVNDVHVNGKKISGILAETTETDTGLAVIVGVGINIRASNYPPEIADIATSIESETGTAVSIEELAEQLGKFIEYFYGLLNEENGPDAIIGEWAKRSTYFSGKHVRVEQSGHILTGVTDGLEPNGGLRLRTDDGIVIVQAGDVTQLRADRLNFSR